jgi:S1-C subfamily serine protease
VLAIGSPLGAFTNTVTGGIVSAIGRNELGGESNFCQNYSNLIQHDAAINQGNSGGPLFNLSGEVVGVNTLGIPTSDQGLPVQGLFFAVPANTVTVAVQQLIETGTIEQPYFGISSIQIDPTTASANDLPVDYGVYVADVEAGGPAAEAGLQPDDIVTAIDGTKITFETPLSDILFNYHPGDTVALTVLRGGEETTVNMTLGQAPQELFEQCTLQGGAP